jgi:hypothetical protein
VESLFQGVVERRIREAMERGEFDDLPGQGEPLRDAGAPYDETWWVKRWLERNGLRPDGSDRPDPQPDDAARR